MKLKQLILGALACAGAWCAQAVSVSYLEPVYDSEWAVTGYETRSAECTEINSGYSSASGGIYSIDSLTLAAGWYVVSGNLRIASTLTISGEVGLILRDGAKLEVNYEKKSRGGLRVEGVNRLWIYAQSTGDNMGQLIATGGKYAAGIGSGSADYVPSGSITINGGRITATGGAYAAAIGSGHYGGGRNITINGGVVTATGGYYGAGIGGGSGNDIYEHGCGDCITINGGTVTATGGEEGAGIGGGRLGKGRYITINGGFVTAKGDNFSAGIGGGAGGQGRDITINGGTVTATGGEQGAGIGSGTQRAAVGISINGGTVTATGGDKGAGIGGGAAATCAYLTINGGMVTAKGGDDGPGIGGGGCLYIAFYGWKDAGPLHNLCVNGGTVRAKAGSKSACDIGHGNPGTKVDESEKSSNFKFLGGSVTTLGEKGIELTPVNASGESVYKTTVTGVDESPAQIVGIPSYYRVNDLYPDAGNLYLWLPSGSYGFHTTTKSYSGSAGTTIDPSGMWYGVAVDGVDVGSTPPSGAGWSYKDGVLTLSEEKDYTLTGANTTSQIRVWVTANANVTLDAVALSTTGTVSLITFMPGVTDATLTLAGESRLYGRTHAVNVKPRAKLTIQEASTGGSIVGDATAIAGRRFCHNEGILVLKGGTIKNYHAPAGWAGGAVYNSATFIMDGGTISGCRSADQGGAVYNAGTFTMNGGTISGCKGSYGGGLYSMDSTAELKHGTISGCLATYGGALALWNTGTVDIWSGMEISGNSAVSHGAVFLQGGTVNVWGGTFRNNSVATGVLTDWIGALNVYGGVFTDNSVKPVHRRDGSTVAVSGGVYDVAPEGIVSGYAAAAVGGKHVVGQNATARNSQLTGGTYTFDPRDAEYAAAGVTVMGNCTVTEHPGTTPKTYVVYVDEEFRVNGELLSAGSGTGWTFDGNTKLLTLNSAMDYALSGHCNLGLKVDVTANAKVALTDIRIHAGDLGRAVFNVTASDAQFSLGGTNEIYTTDGSAAIGVAANAKLTLDGDGALVGGKAADKTCVGVSVTNGTFVMNGCTISGYKGGSYGGGLYVKDGTAELNAGTITDCTANYGGALALWNTGTVNIRSGMVISGNSATSHGAVFQQGGTINVWGGTFTDNTVPTGVLVDWTGVLNVYGGVFTGNSVKPVYRRDGSTVAVSGGLYDTAPDAGLIVSGYAATQVGGLSVIGQGVTQEGGAITGGTYSFDPKESEYAAAGVTVAQNHLAWAQGTTPETYLVVKEPEFKVNGVLLEDCPGVDWTFDEEKELLTLAAARAYELTGFSDLPLKVDVVSNATVTLNGISVRAGKVGREIFSVSAEDATFVLAGTNEVYATDGHAAIGVGPFAKLTVTGDGALVGGMAVGATCLGVSVNSGTFVMNGGTISGYKGGSYGGGLYVANGTAELNAGTITGCSANFGGALVLWNSGTVNIQRGMTISGNRAVSHGAVFLQGGTINVWGGTFTDNTVASGVLTDWIGTLNVFGGVFADNPVKPVYCRAGFVAAVSGGVYDMAPDVGLIVSGYAATQVGDLSVVGQGVSQTGGALTGGMYTFDPTDDLYADVGVAVAEEHAVFAQATDPATYVIDWNWTGFTVNGVDLVLGSGNGWIYDFTSGVLTLYAEKSYVLSGALTREDLDLGVVVNVAATVVLSDATITSSALSPLTVNAAGVTVQMVGENTLTAAGSLPAVAVSSGKSVTFARGGAAGEAVKLVAIGGENAIAIGGEGNVTIASGVIEAQGGIAGGSVLIEGGTVSATGRSGEADIDGTDVRITGGSVVAGKVTGPKNGNGNAVWCVTVPDTESSGPVAITNETYLAESYGQTDLYPVSGALSLWLPNGDYDRFYVGDGLLPYYATVADAPTVASRKVLSLYVNGELVDEKEHEGWSYDGVTRVLTLDATTDYVVTGESMAGDVRIVVAGGCDLTLGGIQLGMGETAMDANLLWIDAGTVNLTIGGATVFQVKGDKAPIGVNAGATLNISGSGTAVAWKVDVVGNGRVTMQDPTTLTYTTQASAEAAAAVVKPVADETDFPGIDQMAYGDRFVVSAVEGASGTWTLDYQVSAATSNEIQNAISSVEVMTNLIESIVGGTPSVTFTPIPGFYYGLAGGTEVTEMDSDAARPPAWYAGQEGKDLKVSGTTFQNADKAFYQLRVSERP